MPLQTQAITPASMLPPGALNALGGPPVAMPSAPDSGAPAAAMPPVRIIGNPTFDDPDPALLQRRETVANVRQALRQIIAAVADTHAIVSAALDTLKPESAAILKADGFDVAAARKFLTDLHAPVAALTNPAPPKSSV